MERKRAQSSWLAPENIEAGVYFLLGEVNNNGIDRVVKAVLLTIQTYSVEKRRVNVELNILKIKKKKSQPLICLVGRTMIILGFITLITE